MANNKESLLLISSLHLTFASDLKQQGNPLHNKMIPTLIHVHVHINVYLHIINCSFHMEKSTQ